ncbi:hypothetical protein [Niallia sp. 03133]|uniref:hypothetical protein n=1 Tax=Niallia sp. 03133 TaxID=3458060 RepID=UPI004043D6B3
MSEKVLDEILNRLQSIHTTMNNIRNDLSDFRSETSNFMNRTETEFNNINLLLDNILANTKQSKEICKLKRILGDTSTDEPLVKKVDKDAPAGELLQAMDGLNEEDKIKLFDELTFKYFGGQMPKNILDPYYGTDEIPFLLKMTPEHILKTMEKQISNGQRIELLTALLHKYYDSKLSREERIRLDYKAFWGDDED